MTSINPLLLVTALTKQANDFGAKVKQAETTEAVTINSTISMLLYALAIAVADATLEPAEPKPLGEILGADENVGSIVAKAEAEARARHSYTED